MRRMLQRLIRDTRALAFIEFALVSPFLLLIVFGSIELARFMLIVQKVDKAAYTLADLTAQESPSTITNSGISVGTMNGNIFPQFARLISPYETANGSVIISSVRRERDAILIKWQIATSSGYNDAETVSVVSGLSPAAVNGAGGGLANRGATFTGDAALEMANMLGWENMVVSEVFYRYRPILSNILSGLQIPFQLGETTLVRRIYSRPRNGNLICLPPTFTYDECIAREPVRVPPIIGPLTCLPVTGQGSCFDNECGDCRRNTREWCTVSATPTYVRCVNGNVVNQNLPNGCTGAGTLTCD